MNSKPWGVMECRLAIMIMLQLVFSCLASNTCPEGCRCYRTGHRASTIVLKCYQDVDVIPNNTVVFDLSSTICNSIGDNFAYTPNISIIIITKCQKLLLSEASFRGLFNMYAISLQDNCLYTFPSGIFADMKNVEGISLDRNQFDHLPNRSFVNQGHLLRLSLSQNQLTHIHSDTFAGLKKLEVR